MPRFIVRTEGMNRLNLRQICEKFVNNDLWIPDDLTEDQAAKFAFDYFKGVVESEMKQLDVQPGRTGS
jgi:hypothetical protein